MNIRRLLLPFLALCLGFNAQGQAEPASGNCEVQQLAINAALGDSAAQYNLAVHFYSGNGVPKDWAKSAILWGHAVKAGNIPAHNNLGYLNYYGGNGYIAKPAEGIRLWRIAAAKGFPESQVHLGVAYYDGIVLPVNLVEAWAWLETGKVTSARLETEQLAEDIRSMAVDNLGDVIKRMTPAQIAAGKARAKIYIARYSPKETHF